MFGSRANANEATLPPTFDDVPPAIPILPDVTPTADERPVGAPRAADPMPELRTLTTIPNQAMLAADAKPYKRIIRLLYVGTALTFELCFRSDFSGESRIVASTADLPFDIPLYPGQRLFLRQATLINHDISVIDAPLEAYPACSR